MPAARVARRGSAGHDSRHGAEPVVPPARKHDHFQAGSSYQQEALKIERPGLGGGDEEAEHLLCTKSSRWAVPTRACPCRVGAVVADDPHLPAWLPLAEQQPPTPTETLVWW